MAWISTLLDTCIGMSEHGQWKSAKEQLLVMFCAASVSIGSSFCMFCILCCSLCLYRPLLPGGKVAQQNYQQPMGVVHIINGSGGNVEGHTRGQPGPYTAW